MVLIQTHNITAPASIFTPNPSRPLSLPSSSTPLRTNHASHLSSASKCRPFPLSTQPRRLLCKPPRGKYIEDDYLVKKKSAKEVAEIVKGERTVPVVIDFYATWCGPCIQMAQDIEMLAVEYEDAIVIKVDTDDEYEFAIDMQVRGLPTVFFISPDPNKEAVRTEGLVPLQLMRDIMNNEM